MLSHLIVYQLKAGSVALEDLSMETLSDEYAKELFADGKHRTQLIRFGIYGNVRWEKPILKHILDIALSQIGTCSYPTKKTQTHC